MSLLPSRPDASPSDDAGPRVIGVDSADADEVIAALSSQTARKLLDELHDEPAPPSELADRVDTSVQNVQYHLEKLENAGAVEVVETGYSEKGREMDIYAPSDQLLVIFAGDERRGATLKTALSRLLGSLGILALASLAIQAVFGDGALFPDAGDDATEEPADDAPADTDERMDEEEPEAGDGGDGGADMDATTADEPTPEPTAEPTPEPTAEPTPEPTAEPTPEPTAEPELTPTPTVEEAQTAVDAAAALPPGVLFFAGGVFTLAVVAVALYLWS